MKKELSLPDLIELAECFTLEQWRFTTKRWHPTMKFLAVLARQKKEIKAGARMLFSRNRNVPGIKNICTILSLSEESLDRAISTFDEGELEYFTALSDSLELAERQLWNNDSASELPAWLLEEFEEKL